MLGESFDVVQALREMDDRLDALGEIVKALTIQVYKPVVEAAIAPEPVAAKAKPARKPAQTDRAPG
jgi:hypothetical protein